MEPKTNKIPESLMRQIKPKTPRKFNSEDKIRNILEGLKGEDSISANCRPRVLPRVFTTNGAKHFYRQANAGVE